MRVVPSEYATKRAYLVGMKGAKQSFKHAQSEEIDQQLKNGKIALLNLGFKMDEIKVFGKSGVTLPYDESEINKVRDLTQQSEKTLIIFALKIHGERSAENAGLTTKFEEFVLQLADLPGTDIIAIFDSCRVPHAFTKAQKSADKNYAFVYTQPVLSAESPDTNPDSAQDLSEALLNHIKTEMKSRGKVMSVPEDLESFTQADLDIHVQGFAEEKVEE